MNWPLLAALFALAAGVGVLYFAVFKEAESEEVGGPDDGKGSRLWRSVGVKDVTAVEARFRKDGKERYRLVATREGDKWPVKIEVPPAKEGEERRTISDDGDGQAVERIANECVTLKSFETLPEVGAERLAEYGLDTPIAEATVTAAGKPIRVRLGKPTIRMDNRVYALVDGRTGILAVSKSLRDACEKEADDFRNHVILPVPPFEAKVLELKMPSGTVRLERGERGWEQKTPVPDRAARDVVEAFYQRLHQSARARRFVDEENPDRKKYGLEPPNGPFLEVMVSDGKAEHRVSYGEGKRPEGDKEIPTVYAFRHADGRIFEVGAENLAPLKVDDRGYFRATDLLDAEKDKLEKVVVKGPGEAPGHELMKEGGWTWKVTKPRTYETDSFKVEDLEKRLDEARVETFVDTLPEGGAEALGLGPGALSVEVTVKEKGATTIQLGNPVPNENRVYARRGNDGPVVTVSADFKTIIARSHLSYVQRSLFSGAWVSDAETFDLEVREGEKPRAESWSKVGDKEKTWRRKTGEITNDHDAVDRVVGDLCALQVGKWVEEDPKDLGKYGLAAEEGPNHWFVKATITLKKGESGTDTKTVYFGKNVEGSASARYGRAEKGHGARGDLVFEVDVTAGEGIPEKLAKLLAPPAEKPPEKPADGEKAGEKPPEEPPVPPPAPGTPPEPGEQKPPG